MNKLLKIEKALVIGANGLVGRYFGELLDLKQVKWQGTFFHRAQMGMLQLDIRNEQEVRKVLAAVEPDSVFFCANLSGGVNYCEANVQQARDFHVHGMQNIGRYCADKKIPLIFISTDYIFQDYTLPVVEEVEPTPLNVYGHLKLEAEKWIQEKLEQYVILRTTNVYGWDPLTKTPNYMMNLYRTISEQKIFEAPSYLWGNPTYAGDLAQAMLQLTANRNWGVYHVVGMDYVDRFTWAQKACTILGLDADFIREVKNMPVNAIPRPIKLTLSTEKFRKMYPIVLHHLEEGLKLMKKDMQKSFV